LYFGVRDRSFAAKSNSEEFFIFYRISNGRKNVLKHAEKMKRNPIAELRNQPPKHPRTGVLRKNDDFMNLEKEFWGFVLRSLIDSKILLKVRRV
jgi:hypothetical protein